MEPKLEVVFSTGTMGASVTFSVTGELRAFSALASETPVMFSAFGFPSRGPRRDPAALAFRAAMKDQGILGAFWFHHSGELDWRLRPTEGKLSWTRSEFSEHRPSPVQKWFLEFLRKRREKRPH